MADIKKTNKIEMFKDASKYLINIEYINHIVTSFMWATVFCPIKLSYLSSQNVKQQKILIFSVFI